MARIHPEEVSEISARASARRSYRRSTSARSPEPAPSPSSSWSSDKENDQRGRLANASMEHAAKRQRTDRAHASIITDTQAARLETNPDLQYYDPNQDIEERRVVRKGLRDLNREAADLRQEWMAPGSTGLKDALVRADTLYHCVRQTSDATIDSRLLVTVGDLTYKKTQQIVIGDGAQGVDVDDFVSKCISFMNRGPESSNAAQSGTQRHRRGAILNNSDEEEGGLEQGDALNWEWFGAKACFPSNARPPVPGFLLGPLSLQKRTRTQKPRRERLQRQNPAEAVRPEELRAADLQQAENTTLTALCTNILRHFREIYSSGRTLVEEELEDIPEDTTDMEIRDVHRRHNLCLDGGISLFQFALNPNSFGQTVENLFYVSFLIKEGHLGVQISEEDDGMPTLHFGGRGMADESGPQQNGSASNHGGEKHQAVFSLDFETWQELVEVFDIRQSLIPDRTQDSSSTQIGARGWYA